MGNIMVNGIPSRKMQCSNHYKEKKSGVVYPVVDVDPILH
jgi:hypothetical protein